jgi:hypothetical protein
VADRHVTREPMSIEEVVASFPTIRQSLLSKLDDCPLSTFFELKYAKGWSTHPQARGTLFHRTAAECLTTMQELGMNTISVSEALTILVEVCRQENVPPEDIVRVPLRDMRELRMAVVKFAKDNAFSTEKIAMIEKRLAATISYPAPGGGFVERELTGQLDALLYDPPNGAIVIDWKDTWGLPPKPKEVGPGQQQHPDDELAGISYHGYFQQRFYGWLVMKNFPQIERVTLREFYPRFTEARKATLTRDRLGEVEEELSVLAQAFDLAVMQGAPKFPYGVEYVDGEKRLNIGSLGRWQPSPGKHCGFCVAARHCPIESDVRLESGGTLHSAEAARQAAAELQVVDRVRDVLLKGLKAYVETTGAPVPVKYAKGRRVIGWHRNSKGGRRFGLYTPDDSDRGGHADLDRQLEEAMRSARLRAETVKP